jgi:hypothetical protein
MIIRAFDTDINEFIDCGEHTINQVNANYGDLGNRFIYDEALGIKDESGSDIYRNDIILDINGMRSLVVYEEGGWRGRSLEKNSLKYTYEWRKGKIIGNAHKNPDLLSELGSINEIK